MHKTNKNIKYLNARERSRYYNLIKISKEKLTDSDLNEIGDLEVRADRAAERDGRVSHKRDWEG